MKIVFLLILLLLYLLAPSMFLRCSELNGRHFERLMLSIACFRAFGNFRLCSSSSFFSFTFPLFSSYSFPLPFSNLLIPLYSSLALNGSQLFPKIGFMVNPIECLLQSVSRSALFLASQQPL